MLAHDGGNRVGVGTALPAPDDGAGIVDDANGGRLERNVEADIMTLLIHAFLRVTFDTAELTGCAWSAADALRLGHNPRRHTRPPACWKKTVSLYQWLRWAGRLRIAASFV